MVWLLIFTNCIICLHAIPFDYNGFKVFRVYPLTEDDLSALVELTENIYLDFWTPLKLNGKPQYIMVHPEAQNIFVQYLNDHEIYFYTFLDDLEMAVKTEKIMQTAVEEASSKYERFEKIMSYLNELESSYENLVELKSIGKSFLKRKTKVCKISTNHTADNPIIFITAGIYGREWFSVALAKYIIKELVENDENRYLMNALDWHLLPVVNPDGYEYAHTHDRFWRKSRSLQNQSCFGVDINRNFGFHWGEGRASSHPCSETFMGVKSFSEPESKNIRDYFSRYKGRIKMYLSFHGHGTEILYPWGYTKKPPVDGSKLHILAEEASNAIIDAGGERFRVEPTVSVVNPAAGSSEDWAKGKEGIDYVFTISLPTGNFGYDPNPKYIEPLARTIFEGVKVFGKSINNL